MRLWLGSAVLFTHFAAIVVIFVAGLRLRYDIQMLLSFSAAITPLAATYGLLFVKYLTIAPNQLESEYGRTVDAWPFAVQGMIVAMFCVVLIGASAFAILGSTDDALRALYPGLVETVFGAYLATIFGRLFPPEIVEQAKG
jgi:hypothetical protein